MLLAKELKQFVRDTELPNVCLTSNCLRSIDCLTAYVSISYTSFKLFKLVEFHSLNEFLSGSLKRLTCRRKLFQKIKKPTKRVISLFESLCNSNTILFADVFLFVRKWCFEKITLKMKFPMTSRRASTFGCHCWPI